MKPFCYGIDIGTNSARLMLAVVENGEIRSHYKLLRTVRTGEGVHASHRLCAAAIERTVCALKEFREHMNAEYPELPVFYFATSAVRDSSNAGELLSAVERAAGLHIRILSGEEEAQIGFLGAVPSGTGGILDIGGGSTEVVTGERGMLSYRHSFDAGAVRCREMFSAQGDREGVLRTAEWAEALFSELKELPQTSFTGIGGTITTVSAMLQRLKVYDSANIQGSRIFRSDVEALLEELIPLSGEQRSVLPGLQPARADIIPYGMAILLAGMRALKLDSLSVSDADNLEGYAIQYKNAITP